MINAIFYIWNWYMYLILSKLFLKPNTFKLNNKYIKLVSF